MRERNQNQFRLARGAPVQVFEAAEKSRGVRHGQHAGVPLGHDDAVLMNRIGGIRRNHRVIRTDDGEQQMRERIFRTDGDDGFRVGIEIDVVIGLIALDDFLPQMRNAARYRVAMVARILGGFDQLVDHHARRSAIGIAHAEIDHILLRGTRSRLHLIDDGENVGRQLLDAIKRIGGISHPLILRGKLPATLVYASRRRR